MNNYTIDQFSQITGLNKILIRTWENRYRFVQPKRTSTNVRYYNDQMITKGIKFSLLVNNGYKISKIVNNSQEITNIVNNSQEITKIVNNNQEITNIVNNSQKISKIVHHPCDLGELG